jgi:hypothetical protein
MKVVPEERYAMKASIWGAAAGVAALVAACTGNVTVVGGSQLCVPGDTRACYGLYSCPGAQICADDGQGWGSCDCGSGAGAGGTGGIGPGGAAPGGFGAGGFGAGGTGVGGTDAGGAPQCVTQAYAGHTYYFCTTASFWDDARSQCLQVSARLVSIGDAAENDWVSARAAEISPDKWWMGFNDVAQEGAWVWEGGSPVTYTDWYGPTGEPNNAGDEDCGQLLRFYLEAQDYGWNDEPCAQALPFVCERSVACLAPPEGILSWWRGEGTALDTMGANPGALTPGATYVPGKVGQAFWFDGQSWLEAPSAGLPLGNAERTLEAWIRVDQLPAWEESFFAGYGAFGSSTATYHFGSTWPNVFFSQWGGNVTAGLLHQGQWHHVAVTNVGNHVILYLDGVSVIAGDLPMATPAGTQFLIGRIPGYLGDIRRIVGAVDEVTIYDRALSAAEIQSIFGAGADGKCPPE